jgi:hypothetical protein
MLTKDEVKNLLILLARCPVQGVTEAQVLVGLAAKLEALLEPAKDK